MAYGNKPYAGYGTTVSAPSVTYSIAAVSPATGEFIDDLSPTFTVFPDSSDGSAMSIEWEWDTDQTFANGDGLRQTKTTTGNVDEVNASTQPDSNFTVNRVYYWRARAGDGVTWSDYTTVRTMRVVQADTAATGYVYQNVGFAPAVFDETDDGYGYVYQNVGFDPASFDETDDGYGYVYQNVEARTHVEDMTHTTN